MRFFIKKLAVVCLCVFFISSCDSHLKLTAYIHPVKEVEFGGDDLHLIQDISFLFLVDTSGSMDQFTKHLSQNISQLLKPIFQKYPYYNYNFAFTTLSPVEHIEDTQNKQPIFVDADHRTHCGLRPSSFIRNANIGSYLHYLSRDLQPAKVEDLICIISHNIEKIEGSAGTEPFFDSLNYIVKKSDSYFASHFFGKGKMLILFFISDAWGEDDEEYYQLISHNDIQSGAEIVSQKQLGLFKAAMGEAVDNIRSYAVVLDAERKDQCGAEQDPGKKMPQEHQYPFHLYKFIKKTKGLRVSICDPFWSRKFVNIFDDLKQAFSVRVFYLEEAPQLDTMEVFLNGKKVPRDVKKGWSFYPENLSLRIGSALNYHIYKNDEENDTFTVRYHPINLNLLSTE